MSEASSQRIQFGKLVGARLGIALARESDTPGEGVVKVSDDPAQAVFTVFDTKLR